MGPNVLYHCTVSLLYTLSKLSTIYVSEYSVRSFRYTKPEFCQFLIALSIFALHSLTYLHRPAFPQVSCMAMSVFRCKSVG